MSVLRKLSDGGLQMELFRWSVPFAFFGAVLPFAGKVEPICEHKS